MPLSDDGFFHAIQQAPDDDAPRLIYSDYLEDQGDDLSVARAELIRLQIERAVIPPVSPRAAELAGREQDLLAFGRRAWVGGWATVLDGWTFRRGFVEAIEADASVFLDCAAEWFAEWPTLTVAKLTRAAGHLKELADSPWLAHLRGLDLSDCGIGGDDLAPLTTSRNIGLLQAIDLGGNPIGPRGADLLAWSATADDLREVHLNGCGLGGCGLDRLLGGRGVPWRTLDLAGNDLDRPALCRLAESKTLQNLRTLDLAQNPDGDYAAARLAVSPHAGGLVDLGLAGTRLGNVGLTALAESESLANLRSLDVRGHGCSPVYERDGNDHGGIGCLARSPLLGRLRRLLMAYGDTPNGWGAGVLGFARKATRRPLFDDWWIVHGLRKSPYLMPSRIEETDLEELWWLGDRANRDRVPSAWRE